MATPLLQTKLYIPAPRPELVPRSRLIERLNAGLHRKLTLISAPAGFGKTTLISEWVADLGRAGCGEPSVRTAWLSLDEHDNDPLCFLTYLTAALQAGQQAALPAGRQTVGGSIGQGALAALQSPGAINVEAVLTTLLNDIAGLSDASSTGAGKRLILVLDDYHAIEGDAVRTFGSTQSIDKALTFVLDHLPPPPGGLHLVIASRTDPTLPLSRLRARGQLTELREADLRFSTDEAAAFLKQVVRLPISTDDVRTLEERTEGWITGLQLAALALQGLASHGLGQRDRIADFIRSFGGSHRYVIDYLVDEVFAQQTPQIQEFLLQTSILDRMVAPLCNAVAGREDSQAILERLEAANLFVIPLDGERRWYRYHHLFADLLRYRLQREQAGTLSGLYRRASKWYEQNGFITRALDHAIAADDIKQAVRLVKEHYQSALQQGDVSAVLRWMESLPEDVVRMDALLSIGYAWGLFLSGQVSAIQAHLQDAEAALAGYAASGDSEKVAELYGEMATLRAYLLRVQGDPVRGIKLAEGVLDQVPEDNLAARGVLHTVLGGLYTDAGDIARASRSFAQAIPICQVAGNIMAATIAVELLVRLLVMQGQLRRAAEVCRQMIESPAGPDGHGGQQAPETDIVADVVRASMSSVLYEWNEIADAKAYVRQGIEQGKRGGFFQAVVFGQILLARVLQARGDADGATHMLQEAAQSARMNPPEWYRTELAACQVQLWLAQGNLAAASSWARERGASEETELNPRNESRDIALARVLTARAQAAPDRTTLSKALTLIERLSLTAKSAGRMGHLIRLLSLQALALDARGDRSQALACLKRALELAEPEGYIRTFVDCGAPMVQLLRDAGARGMMPGYTSKLLSAFEEDARAKPTPSSQPLVEPLSERELEVLRLVAQGFSNREIAEQLYLALSTIKGYNRNIYGKLQVQRRTEAVARARELGLI